MKLRLSLAFGCTLAELEHRISYEEYRLWCEYYAVSPWGQDRDDISRAFGAAAVCNSLGGKIEFGDLIPDYDPPEVDEKVQREIALIEFEANIAAINRGYECRRQPL